MNKPHIDRAIKILDNLGYDIPYIDTVIEKAIYLVGKKFGAVEMTVQNGVIHLVSYTERRLMKP